MNKLFVIALLAGGLYLGYQNNVFDAIANFGEDGPIEDPVFARMSVDLRADGREVEGILIGKMRSQEDCQQRLDMDLRDMFAQCPDCQIGSVTCSDDIAARELGYFEQTPTHLTYLHGAPGDSDEREFAMIYWGLTVQEARLMCSIMENVIAREYQGELSCIQEHDV